MTLMLVCKLLVAAISAVCTSLIMCVCMHYSKQTSCPSLSVVSALKPFSKPKRTKKAVNRAGPVVQVRTSKMQIYVTLT